MCVMCSVTQSWPIFCDSMERSPPESSVHEIFWARILEWVAISYSRGTSQPKDGTCVSYISCQFRRCRRHGFDPWVGKFPWSRKWQPIPVFLPGKFHEQRSLAGYSPWSHKELDTADRLTLSLHFLLTLKLHLVT